MRDTISGIGMYGIPSDDLLPRRLTLHVQTHTSAVRWSQKVSRQRIPSSLLLHQPLRNSHIA